MSANALSAEELAAKIVRAPFHQWLGLHLIALRDDEIELGITWRDEMLVNVERNYAHGGILATIVDVTADWAIAAKVGGGVPTIDLRVDYHRPAGPGALRAVGRVIKLGKTVSTAEATVYDTSGNLVASGRGVYSTASA